MLPSSLLLQSLVADRSWPWGSVWRPACVFTDMSYVPSKLHPCHVHLFSTVTGGKSSQLLPSFTQPIQVDIRELSYEPLISSEYIANAFLLLSNLKTWTLAIRMALVRRVRGPIVSVSLISCYRVAPTSSPSPYVFHIWGLQRLLAPPKLVSLNITKTLRTTLESLLNAKRADVFPMPDLYSLQSLTNHMVHGPAEQKH